MTITTLAAAQLAEELHHARRSRRPVAPISSRVEGFDYEDAYRVQERGIELRIADGESILGGKLGFTSRAMQRAMGVDRPNYGWLTGPMLLHDRHLDIGEMIHPKAEPEIGFLLADDLGPETTARDVIAATAVVFPCLEVVDSRFMDFKFELVDNIADNSSAGKLVAGPAAASPAGIPLSRIGVSVKVNGELFATAAGAAALDDPAEAVAWMARNTQDRGLLAGDLVISGGLTAPVDLASGTIVEVSTDRLGATRLVVD